MKCIDGHELTVISNLVFELERRLDLYGCDMESECKEEMEDELSTLNGILEKDDYVPEVKYVEVEVPVEKLLNAKEVEDRIKTAEKRGRETVNPNFKYCVFDSHKLRGALYVTDDFAVAIGKAKSLSLAEHGIYGVYSIKEANDGTFKTFGEGGYYDGESFDCNLGESFLHFDYLVQAAGGVVKL